MKQAQKTKAPMSVNKDIQGKLVTDLKKFAPQAMQHLRKKDQGYFGSMVNTVKGALRDLEALLKNPKRVDRKLLEAGLGSGYFHLTQWIHIFKEEPKITAGLTGFEKRLGAALNKYDKKIVKESRYYPGSGY